MRLADNMVHLGLGATVIPQPGFTGLEWYADYGERVAADGAERRTTLGAGEYAINPPGVWHTADLTDGPATAVFITAGLGTELRAR